MDSYHYCFVFDYDMCYHYHDGRSGGTQKRNRLKKALGASNKSVVIDFLGEAVMLGLMGGILGIGLGYLFANNVSISVFAREVSFPIRLAPFTVISSIVITIVASLFPVRATVDVDPALVLRGE